MCGKCLETAYNAVAGGAGVLQGADGLPAAHPGVHAPPLRGVADRLLGVPVLLSPGFVDTLVFIMC